MKLATRFDDRAPIRRNAWFLAIVVICIYIGYIVWNWLRSAAASNP